MTRSPFAKALSAALTPLGFSRSGDDWIRVRGEIWECVNRQSSWLGAGVTANLMMKDVATEKLFLEILAPTGAVQMPPPATTRIATLIDGYDRWWARGDPHGPTEMAAAVVEYGLPWFSRIQSLEDEASLWHARKSALAVRGYHGPTLVGLALTLYRMGKFEEALEVTRKPTPRTAIPGSVEMVARVRAWLERQSTPS